MSDVYRMSNVYTVCLTYNDSCYCLEHFVLEGMRRVCSGGDEPNFEVIGVGNHKRRSLSTQLPSGTSAETFACPAGPCRNCRGEASTKNEPNRYFVPDQKKWVRKSTFTFRTKDLVDFVFEGFRSTFKYVCYCVCVCVCTRERKIVRECICESVCVFVYVQNTL